MALTTAQAFAAFLEAISPTDSQKQDISDKRQATERNLRKAFPASSTLPLSRVILIGSAARGTIIRPVQDIDVMAVFVNREGIFEQYRSESDVFLQRIRMALNAKTSIKKIGARGQAVRLFYTSGAHVDIAPVFKWRDGGFALPKGDGNWMTTDPEYQAKWYSARHASVGTNLTPLVKLARRWNVVHSRRFEPYHLEVMVAKMFKAVDSNHRDNLKCFFEAASRRVTCADPAGHSGNLDGYLTEIDRLALESRFSEALARAKLALLMEARGNHTEAKRLWRIELGEEFPA